MTTSTLDSIAGPAWDNSSEYPGLDSPAFQADFDRAEALTAQIEALASGIEPALGRVGSLTAEEERAWAKQAQEIGVLWERASVLIANLATFANCEKSVDTANAAAERWMGTLSALSSRLSQAVKPHQLLLTLGSDSLVALYLDHPETRPEAFQVRRARTLRDHKLSLAEEKLIEALTVDGHEAWGKLHTKLSGTIPIEVETASGRRTVGFANAAKLQGDPDEKVRKAAYDGVQQAWERHENTCAAALNALAGWRIELCRKRSFRKPTGYLDQALFQSRIEEATLDAMMSEVRSNADIAHRAIRLTARTLGEERLSPWNRFAPLPSRPGEETETALDFGKGMGLVERAFASVHPSMADFARMMEKNRWIEARVSDTRLPGAYCTGFRKSRNPRVYMTYAGSMREVVTLAHELGHAFHGWVMRDIPLAEASYPMTLAETASVFAETALRESLGGSGSEAALRNVAWEDIRGAATFLADIPMRFQFERSLYDLRMRRQITAQDCRKLMLEAADASYGQAVSAHDPLAWATKLHYFISQISFYNCPYTFGYLFSLGVYAQRGKLGSGFFDAYVSLLRDTGRMTAEELAQKHLGVDLRKPDFWRESLRIVRGQVERAEKVLGAPGLSAAKTAPERAVRPPAEASLI